MIKRAYAKPNNILKKSVRVGKVQECMGAKIFTPWDFVALFF
jgi:hypothetical protein